MYPSAYKRLIGFVLRSSTFLLIFLSVVFVSSASARTWHIKPDGTGDAPTIQAGVDSAAGGDTVLVGEGTYSDTTHIMVAGTLRAVNVHIQKQITLLGELSAERPFIDGVHSYIGIFVESVSSTVSIGHLKLRGGAFLTPSSTKSYLPNSESEREYPARIRCHSSSLEIFDADISHDHDGVFLSNSTAEVRASQISAISTAIFCCDGSNTTICGNTIVDGADGVTCDGASAVISDNTIGAPEPLGMGIGIDCYRGSSVYIEGNTIEWCGSGVAANGCELTINGNRFAHHDYGIQLINSSSLITNNLLYQGWYAIWVSSGATGEILNNTIDSWIEGIFSELGASHTIRRNIITRVNWGITCLGATATIECNDIFDAGSGLYDECQVPPLSDNFSADPEYCGVDDSGNYFLQSDSPCAPGNHPDGRDCGLIGAQPVNCGIVDAKQNTWGSIKNRFNDGGD